MYAILKLASFLAAVAIVAMPTRADEPMRTISVTGEGKANAPPDMATIATGVVTQAETAQLALKENKEAMASVIEVLEEHHVAAKDVQTSSFNVSPVYKRDERGRQKPEIAGYRVQNQVRVRARNLADLGKVLDALVGAGSNQISGISFGVDDPIGILNQARSEAIRDAKSRAEVYAQSAGVRVGRVRTISEQPVTIPRPLAMDFARAEAAAVPVATGEQEFRVTVHVVFELDDANGD